MDHADAIKAARHAFHAYEKAIEAAAEVKRLGPPTGFGTCIMTEVGFGGSYQCSECEHSGHAATWKFCPNCGAEIMRFDKKESTGVIAVKMEKVESAPIRVAVTATHPNTQK